MHTPHTWRTRADVDVLLPWDPPEPNPHPADQLEDMLRVHYHIHVEVPAGQPLASFSQRNALDSRKVRFQNVNECNPIDMCIL